MNTHLDPYEDDLEEDEPSYFLMLLIGIMMTVEDAFVKLRDFFFGLTKRRAK